MVSQSRLLGIALTLLGLTVGVAYPYILISMPEERAVKLIIATFAIAALLIGSVIGAVGVILVRGMKVSSHEDTSEE